MKAANRNCWQITSSELSLIKKSTDLARANQFFASKGINSWMEEAEANLSSSDEKRQATGVFNLLRLQKFCSSLELNGPVIRKVVVAALESNDSRFFVWMGRILSANRTEPKSGIKRLPLFLLDHWDRADDGLPELFYLTKKGVTDVCEAFLGEFYTEDAVRKQCERLGLRSFSGRKIRVVIERTGAGTNRHLIFQQPDGKRLRWSAPVSGCD